MKAAILILLFLSGMAWAHDVALVTQHVAMKRQHKSGWQQDLIGRAVVSRMFDLGLQATYLERFDFHENRVGGFLIYHPSHELTLEARYLRGKSDNEILPEDEYNLSAYYSLAAGLTPYLIYRDVHYSVTRLHTASLGLEIEKIANIILIPQLMLGRGTFPTPAQTKDVYSVGLRAQYYREKVFSLFAFGYKGKEASQGIVGRSNVVTDTLTGGLGAGYFFTPALRAELSFDHTDYQELKTQFLTTTLNLRWIF